MEDRVATRQEDSDKAEIDKVFHSLNSECGKVWLYVESSLRRICKKRLTEGRRRGGGETMAVK